MMPKTNWAESIPSFDRARRELRPSAQRHQDQRAQRLSIMVVPGSGTGGLAGMSGEFRIEISEGRHSYEFEYSLP
jgi:hypothetical protein